MAYPRLKPEQEKANDKLILDTLISKGIPAGLAKMQLAQCRYETTHYSSRAFNEENNIGGLKYPGNGVACTKGKKSPEGDYYAKYSSVSDSAKDMANWLLRNLPSFQKVESVPQFAAVLKAFNYFSAPLAKYAADIASIYKRQLGYINITTPQTTAALTQKKTSPFL